MPTKRKSALGRITATAKRLRIKRDRETAEEKARRLEDIRIRATLYRAAETPEERQRRLEKQRIQSSIYRERQRRVKDTGATFNGHNLNSTGKRKKTSVSKRCASGKVCVPTEQPMPGPGFVEFPSIKDEISATPSIDCEHKFLDVSIFAAASSVHCKEDLIDCEDKLQNASIFNPEIEHRLAKSGEIEIYEPLPMKTEKLLLMNLEEPVIKIEDLHVSKVDEESPRSTNNCIFEECFGRQNGIRMLQLLTETYANKKHSNMKILDESNNFVISVVSPFMQRVGEKLKQSSEIVFVSSVTSLDPMGCTVVIMMTNSFAGGLPLALIVTSPGAAEALTDGMQMLRALLSETAFGGRGPKGPVLFMVSGDNKTESLALLSAFPVARLLFCQFQMIQTMRRCIGKRNFNVISSHKLVLLHMFESLVYESDKGVFEQKVGEVLNHSITLLYRGFRYLLKELLEDQKSWATCHRTDLITRGQNTNSLSAATIRVIHNALLPFKVLSPVHLLNMLMEDYQQIYIDKLIAAAHFCPPSYLQSRAELLRKKCDHLIYLESEGKVLDLDRDQTYVIDPEIGLCDCPEGANGRMCLHLFMVMRNSNTNLFLTLPMKKFERKNCIYIATGRYSLDESCRRLLKEPAAIGEVKNSIRDVGADSVRPDNDNEDSDREPIFVTVDDNDAEFTAEWNECVVDDVDPETIADRWWSDIAEQTSSDERVSDEIDNMQADLKTKIAENPALLASLKMISSYQRRNTPTALGSVILYFAE